MNAAPTGGTVTPLGEKLREKIRRDGPMSVALYMEACLTDPEHGYYRRKAAIGAVGDFITAPEISQIFGELIGLWAAVVWQQMGAPSRIALVELGPGRGTLMRDALRAARIVPGFLDATDVHLVDTNATLRETQRVTLSSSGVPVHFHADVTALRDPARVPEGAAIIIGNEFLDALPIAQFEYARGRWLARHVTASPDGLSLAFAAGAEEASPPPEVPPDAHPKDGDIFETSPLQHALAGDVLGARAALGPLAGLFVDYGHATTGFGDTLQGVAGQAYVSPLEAPGEADLSAQVDFAQFAAACREAGLDVDGPVPQAQFLGRLGAVERASRLMAANAPRAAAIEAQVQRIMAPSGMGSRFLAIGVRSRGLAPLPALA